MIRAMLCTTLIAAAVLLGACADMGSHKLRSGQPDQNPAHQMHN